jgi:hypothetical protein
MRGQSGWGDQGSAGNDERRGRVGEAARYRRRSSGRGGRRVPPPWIGLRRTGAVLLSSGLALLGGTGLAPAAQAAGVSLSRPTVVPTRGSATADPALQQASTAEQTAQTQQADTAYPAVVSLTSISPVTSTITVSGTVKNSGSSTLSVLDVGAAVGVANGPLERSQIAAIAGTGTPQAGDAPELTSPAPVQLGSLAPGATSAPFTLVIPISSLGLTKAGVYELDVIATDGSASSTTGLGTTPQELGILRTFLPYYTPGARATEVATLWPLVDTPRVQPQQYDVTQSNQAVLTDDELADELGTDGRLGQLETIGRTASALDLSWVIDPDLVSTVDSMAGPYRVRSGSDDLVPAINAACRCTTAGTGSAAATAWLENLQTALTGLTDQQVIALPFADPDLASLAHDTSDTAVLQKYGALSDAADAGETGLDLLKVDADHSVAWPYQGYVDPLVVGVARDDLHDTQIVANSTSLPRPSGMTFTPNAARPLGDGMTAVVADSTISDIFSGDLSTTSEQVMAEQRFLAETLEITEELPNSSQPRTILIAPPRTMTASTADTLVDALQEAVAGKWIQPATYGEVAAAKPTPGVGTAMTPYPSSVSAGELSSLPNVAGVQNNLDELQKIVAPPDPYRAPFYASMLRSVSTQWRGQSQAGNDYLSNVQQYLATLQSAVAIINPGTITLPGSSTATIPITVENNLPQTVTNLQVRLESGSPTRLKLKSDGSQSVTASGETKPSFRFQVQATVNGPVTMTAQLYSADGEPFGRPLSFTVTVTQVSGGVIAVIAGGVLLVLLAGLRLYWKRKKDAASAPEGGSGGAEGAEETGSDAEEGSETALPDGHDPENGV